MLCRLGLHRWHYFIDPQEGYSRRCTRVGCTVTAVRK